MIQLGNEQRGGPQSPGDGGALCVHKCKCVRIYVKKEYRKH